MKILAFDTTGEIESIAILDSGKIIDISQIEEKSSAAELLVPAIDEIMQRNNLTFNNLDLVTTTKGPASFTSVRIGLACAKGLALASKKQLLTYDSLLVKAYSCIDFKGKITVCMDAKMNEFFVASFISNGNSLKIDQESYLAKNEDLKEINLENNQLIIGSGESFLTKIAKNKGLTTNSRKDKLFLADDLAIMTYIDFTNNKDSFFANNSNPNYIRDPKIGVRKN